MSLEAVVRSMKRKARQILKKYADKEPSVSTASAMYKEFDEFIQPLRDSSYIFYHKATFHMAMQHDQEISRSCKMVVGMTQISPLHHFEVELETPEDPSVAYNRAMKVL